MRAEDMRRALIISVLLLSMALVDVSADDISPLQVEINNQFNSTLADARQRFNVENQRVIDQSNVQWRRALNTANTAGQNAVNQANAMNAFNLSNQGLSFLWQEMRDAAKWEYEAAQNAEERQTNIAIAALGNEAAESQGRADTLKTLGGFALDIWDRIDKSGN